MTVSHFLLQGKRQTWYNSTLASRRKRLTAHFEDLEQCYFSNKMSRITGTDIAENIGTLPLLLLAAKREYYCHVVGLCSAKVCIIRKNWTMFERGMEKENKKHPKDDLVAVSVCSVALPRVIRGTSSYLKWGRWKVGGKRLVLGCNSTSRLLSQRSPPWLIVSQCVQRTAATWTSWTTSWSACQNSPVTTRWGRWPPCRTPATCTTAPASCPGAPRKRSTFALTISTACVHHWRQVAVFQYRVWPRLRLLCHRRCDQEDQGVWIRHGDPGRGGHPLPCQRNDLQFQNQVSCGGGRTEMKFSGWEKSLWMNKYCYCCWWFHVIAAVSAGAATTRMSWPAVTMKVPSFYGTDSQASGQKSIRWATLGVVSAQHRFEQSVNNNNFYPLSVQEHEKRCWSVDFNLMDPKLLASGSDDAKGNWAVPPNQWPWGWGGSLVELG